MSPNDRAKNAAFLCCHFSRNLAYYNAANKGSALDREGFWLTIAGDFVDICALEWCKLFGNQNGKYHWKNVLQQPNDFKAALLSTHRLTQNQFDELYKKIKNYRDEFVAHSEDDETIKVPCMSTAYLLVWFYYRRLQCDFPELESCEALPKYLETYFAHHLREAGDIFRFNRPMEFDAYADYLSRLPKLLSTAK